MTKVLLLVAFLALVGVIHYGLEHLLAFRPPTYLQSDPKWGNITLGYGPANISAAGCLMTSISSMAAGEGIKMDGAPVNPETMNYWLLANNGYADGDDFVWASIDSLGFTFEGFDNTTTQALSDLHSGKLVILNVAQGHHYVLATGSTDVGFTVMDPAGWKAVYPFDEVVRSGIYIYHRDFLNI